MTDGAQRVRGAVCGLTAAALFGLSAPLAKVLLPGTGALVLAALLYLGGGLGLALAAGVRAGARAAAGRAAQAPAEAPLGRRDVPLLLAIIVCGGMVGPVLMLLGLGRLSGVAGSLLLNLEGPFTILLALAVFGEHLGWRGALAAVCTLGGALLLRLAPGEVRAEGWGVAALAGACGAWALDNNLTQRLSLKSPLALVRVKTLGAGGCMLGVALLSGQPLPPVRVVAGALALGACSYGLSIVLDTYALRLLGAAREAALFATAPFVGALASLPLLGEGLRPADVGAGALMAAGVVLLLRERHGHVHTHEALVHEHLHVHDAHHQHAHAGGEPAPGEAHSHPHRHTPLTHDHPHVSDAHHRHRH